MSAFGEIVEPTTRTAWEDWDDNIPDISHQLKWKLALDVPKNINLFVLYEGKYLSDCIKKQAHPLLKLINTIPEIGLELYNIKDSDKYVCSVRDYEIVMSSEVVCLLQPLLVKSQNVVAIQMKPIVEFQSLESVTLDCVMRSVTTSERPNMILQYPRLEQPNILSGVTAGVICLREHLNKSGIAIVCYVESPQEFHVQEIQKLLLSLGIVDVAQSEGINNNLLFTNLYI